VTLQASITDDHKQAAPAGVASQSAVRSNSNLQQQQHLEPPVDSSGPGSSGYDVAEAKQQQQQQQHCTSAQQQAHIAAAAQQFIEDATASIAAGDGNSGLPPQQLIVQKLFADSQAAYEAELHTAFAKGYNVCLELSEPKKLAAAAAESNLSNALAKQAALRADLAVTQQLLIEAQQRARASAVEQQTTGLEQYLQNCIAQQLLLEARAQSAEDALSERSEQLATETEAHRITALAKAQRERLLKVREKSEASLLTKITALEKLISFLRYKIADVNANLDSCHGQVQDMADDQRLMDGIMDEQVQLSLVWQLFKHICWLVLFICAWESWLRKIVLNGPRQGALAAVPQLQQGQQLIAE
jgi:hypothetical protein